MEETNEYKQFLEEREIYRKTCRVSDEKIKELAKLKNQRFFNFATTIQIKLKILFELNKN
jgi:hypothetical protein